MSQKREGKFYVLEDEEYNSRIDEHQKFVETMQKHEFTNIKTLKGNRFSIPFQDIWANPEQTHQVYFVYDPIVNTNYLRIRGDMENKPESISNLSRWFTYTHDTELDVAVEEALENGDEDEQAQAIFNFAVDSHLYFPDYSELLDKYLKSPSVKVRLATIRAIGFHFWSDCPHLEKVIQEDSHRAVRDYASEIKRQIQQPDFDPDDLYEHPENYPNSLERVTDKAFQILPQLRDDLQVWMKKRGIDVIDALDLYQYLNEADLSSKSTEAKNNTSNEEDSLDSSQPDTTAEHNESQQAQSKRLEQLQQELTSNKQKLAELRTQLKKVEERIKQARKTNIFGRKQSGENERERDKLTQEIKDAKNRIAENESSIKALEE